MNILSCCRWDCLFPLIYAFSRKGMCKPKCSQIRGGWSSCSVVSVVMNFAALTLKHIVKVKPFSLPHSAAKIFLSPFWCQACPRIYLIQPTFSDDDPCLHLAIHCGQWAYLAVKSIQMKHQRTSPTLNSGVLLKNLTVQGLRDFLQLTACKAGAENAGFEGRPDF